MLTRKQFEDELTRSGVIATGEFSEDGLTQRWKKPDGNDVTVPVFDAYPEYILEKFRYHYKIPYMPLYNSNQILEDRDGD